MTDETTMQPQGEAPAAEAAPAAPAQPAPNAPADVESIVSERLAKAQEEWEAKVNERITGFQRLVSERDEQIKQLKTASMSEEDRAQLEIEEQERERAAFETERWLFNKAKENSTAAEMFQKVLNTEDPEEQWAIFVDIASRLASPAPAPAPQPEPAEQVSDIDRNNPAPQIANGTPVLADGTVLDKAFRENYLRNLGSVWPGMERG